MNVMLIGGAGHFIDSLIIKLNKEGHRVYLLTGTRYRQESYQQVFERYDFTYDADCLQDIFESTAPDVTIFMGAYDTNFDWEDEEKTSIKFSTSLTNILMSYAMSNRGRFIYLSSDEVFGLDYPENITEKEEVSPATLRGLALSQGEAICKSYREGRNLDVVVARLDHYYCIPSQRKDVQSIPAKMCLEVLEKKSVTVVPNNVLSLVYETDALESIYRLVECSTHRHPIYHISTSVPISETEICEMVTRAVGNEMEVIEKALPGRRCVLSGNLFDNEFGKPYNCDAETIVRKISEKMFKNSYVFLTGEKTKLPFWKRFAEKSGWFVKMLIPFAENLVCFLFFFLMNFLIGDSKYFQRLDIYLLYVLLFAVVYGQQQAVFSSLLATAGFIIQALYKKSGIELFLDTNTYIWIAQLFVVGLVVGYLKDFIVVIKKESEEVQEFLSLQLTDMQDINASNVRVKNALETQLVNQSDSVGKIYRITSALDHYSPEEVLFYAADVISKLMGSKDIAVYTITGESYARLFSATSPKARMLGNSLKYRDMGELYEMVSSHKVYINRKLDEKYPLMANAIFEEEQMAILVFVWGIPWDHMTLGQANQLSVASALIQDAVLRANRYMAALENRRYVEDSSMLETEALQTLIKAYRLAQSKGLTECSILKVNVGEQTVEKAGVELAAKLRHSDYIGTLNDGNLYILLANTNTEDSAHAINRIKGFGFETDLVEDIEL